jgi:acetyl esterase
MNSHLRLWTQAPSLVVVAALFACGLALGQQPAPTVKKRKTPVPTHERVAYGPHAHHVMDVWLVESPTPTPVLVSIHGGGFLNGDPYIEPSLLKLCREGGISVAAITYRRTNEAIAPAAFLDSARAVQFIRSKAKEWNLDAKRIAARGESAGAGISLWLGFHDDLADPKSADPVSRESTRLTCMVTLDGQSSYDPRFIRDLFPGADIYKNPAFTNLFGFDMNKLDEAPPEKVALFEQCAPINFVTKDDVPALMVYTRLYTTPPTEKGSGTHHPLFGKKLKERMDGVGVECRVETGVSYESQQWPKLAFEFIKEKFGMRTEGK